MSSAVCVSQSWQAVNNIVAAALINDANVALNPRIDFEVAGKLTAESSDLDGLAGAQAAHVYACRSGYEGMNFAGAVIDEDDESERQIIHDRLSDCPGDRDEAAFSVFTDVAGCHRFRLYFWTTAMRFDVCDVDEYEQSG